MDTAFEVISTVRRRRRWTVEQKVRILDEAFGPGGSVAAAADAHDLSRPLIYLWRRQAREGGLPGVALNADAPAGFAPVRLATPAPQHTVAGREPRPQRVPRGRRHTIEVALANGRSLKVGEDIDPHRLASLVAALDAPSP